MNLIKFQVFNTVRLLNEKIPLTKIHLNTCSRCVISEEERTYNAREEDIRDNMKRRRFIFHISSQIEHPLFIPLASYS